MSGLEDDDYDVDRILDEIARSQQQQQQQKHLQATPQPLRYMAPNDEGEMKVTHKDLDLSTIIDDICSAMESLSDTVDGKRLKPRRPSIATHASESLDQKQRCCPTYLGDSSVQTGLNRNGLVNPRSCQSLRCVRCDFPVIQLDDLAWHESTDYLFLRNHMPDIAKLRDRLFTKKGCRAYGCQCSWRNVWYLQNVKGDSALKWTCTKH